MSTSQKIYRMPFRKTITFGSVCAFILSLSTLALAIYLTLFALAHTHNIFITPWWAHLLVITFILELWLFGVTYFTTFCYLILYDDKMVIKNILFPFYSKKIFFRDLQNKKIVRVFTHNYAVRSPYSTRMITLYKKGKKWPEKGTYYYLKLVYKSDLVEIASFLREKGIDVVVSNKSTVHSSILDKSGID